MEYISAVETNKMIRKVLKEAFPSVKFSVRKSGNSTNVDWKSGPTIEQVKELVDRFSGSYFDGMIDYQGSLFAEIDGKPVSFMVDFIFYEREFSKEETETALNTVSEYWGINDLNFEDYDAGKYYNRSVVEEYEPNYLVATLVRKELAKTSFVVPNESKTANSVKQTKSDGYGCNPIDGMNGSMNGYPK
jgi:hypothetical protein